MLTIYPFEGVLGEKAIRTPKLDDTIIGRESATKVSGGRPSLHSEPPYLPTVVRGVC